MKTQWRKLILEISFWLLLEAFLSSMGIDELADYSEFLVMSKKSVQL